MVEVGEIEIIGQINEDPIVSGLENIENVLKNIENQFNQLDPSLKRAEKSFGNISNKLKVIGISGVAAITALAVKSPVLANTMAKIEVNTLKLSNTLGRQLRPIFEEIATGLIPAINNAFLSGSDSISIFVDKTTNLVEILTDLINLDFTSLITDLDSLLGEKTTSEKAVEAFTPGESFLSKVLGDRSIISGGGKIQGAIAAGSFGIDIIQWLISRIGSKEEEVSSASGVTRGTP